MKDNLEVWIENQKAADAAAKYLGYAEASALRPAGVHDRTSLLRTILSSPCAKMKDAAGRTLISITEYYSLVQAGKVEWLGKPQTDTLILPEGGEVFHEWNKKVEGVYLDGQFLKGYFWWVEPTGVVSGSGGRWKITLDEDKEAFDRLDRAMDEAYDRLPAGLKA